MKDLFYYIKGENGAKVITVCLIKGELGYYRGVAICSVLEKPNKKEGRRRALARARRAFGCCEIAHKDWDGEPINIAEREWDVAIFSVVINGWYEKSTYNTWNQLTKYEQEIVTASERNKSTTIHCQFTPTLPENIFINRGAEI
jgi:hypothetical protein